MMRTQDNDLEHIEFIKLNNICQNPAKINNSFSYFDIIWGKIMPLKQNCMYASLI